MYTIQLKKVRENAILPKRVTKGSAAYDAIIPEDYKLKYGKQIIPLGWCSAMPVCLRLDERICRLELPANSISTAVVDAMIEA